MQSVQTWVGIDVSQAKLEVCRWRKQKTEQRSLDNDAAGHGELCRWLGKGARVVVEATGAYHVQMAMTLVSEGLEVMVINPRVARDFAKALSNRSKTDRVDASVLLEYAQRMEFRPWQPPSAAVMQLRELGRRLTALVGESVDEQNRLHAQKVAKTSRAVINDIEAHVGELDEHIARIEKAALEVIREDAYLMESFELLRAAKGIANRSAVLLLTELAVLDPTMSVRQVVAHAGLDPREYQSGSSVQKPPRISKAGNARLRAILYMNALSAIRHDKGARLFAARLRARGKKPMQAVVAVMRKLLHGIWIVLQRRVPFDNSILFAASLAQAESSDSAVAATQPEPSQEHPKGRSEAEELRQQLAPGSAEAIPRPKSSKAA